MKAPLPQLLVHFDDSPAALCRLDMARRIAQALESAVTAIYAVTPAVVEVPYAAEAGPQAVEALNEIDLKRREKARAAFDEAIAKSPGAPAQWGQLPGYPLVPQFAAQALYADLLVLGQHEPGAAPAGVPFDLAQAMLFASGKPALVVPFVQRERAAPQEIVIAWKPTPQAARAVAAAVPLMQRARRVHVLTWGDEPEPPAVTGAPLNLDGYLRLRGIAPQWHRQGGGEPDDIGQLLLSSAFDLGGDLLVMGCYGHSRAREWVLGGASRAIFSSMTLPVLMAH
jgi:nucleotide-binding universal stress UspA family protein